VGFFKKTRVGFLVGFFYNNPDYTGSTGARNIVN